jgi:restriction endonuclease Mrr
MSNKAHPALLMIENNIGVSKVISYYNIKKIDSDYFAEK